jgi:DMSO/TMAO reductase YedYZ heme-binding membrane subunit
MKSISLWEIIKLSSSIIFIYNSMKNILKKTNFPLSIFIIIICTLWFKIYFDAFIEGEFLFHLTVKETGELAFKLLIFMIFISLAQKITFIHFPKLTIFSKMLILRKWSGILAFIIAGAHGIAEISRRGFEFETIINTSFTTHNAAIFGTISFLIMLPLFLTSTNWAIKKMGYKTWKNLQRFAHLSFLFAIIHVALIDYFNHGEIEFEAFILLIIYLSGYLYLLFYKKYKS